VGTVRKTPERMSKPTTTINYEPMDGMNPGAGRHSCADCPAPAHRLMVRHSQSRGSCQAPTSQDPVPPENRIWLMTCGLFRRQAACVYSFIRPLRTDLR
jgi:hypothetical protein